MCVHLNKEKQSRDADTNNKEERLTTNKLSCGSIHSIHESLVDVLVSFHMLQVILHVVGLVAVCAEFTCCQCTKLNHFLTCTGITCRDSQCENGLVRCCLYRYCRYAPQRLHQQRWKHVWPSLHLRGPLHGAVAHLDDDVACQMLVARFPRAWQPDNGRTATSRDTTLTGVITAALLSKASGSTPRRARLEPQYFWPQQPSCLRCAAVRDVSNASGA